MDRINTLAEWVQEGLEPDLTLLLDAPAEIGMNRAEKRGATDRLESEKMSFYARARQGYLSLADAEPDRFAVINADQPLAQVKADIAIELAQLMADN